MTRTFYVFSYGFLSVVGSLFFFYGEWGRAVGFYFILQAIGLLADGITDKLDASRV